MGAVAVDRLLKQAVEHYGAGRAGEADNLCGDILTSQPYHITALHLAAVIAFADGRMPDGSALLSRVFALDPGHVPALITLGDALAVKGEHEGALATFQRVAALRPRDAGLQSKLGTALVELSKFEEAETVYRRALELDPNMTRARCNLAVALAGLDKLVEAEQTYRAVLQSDPAYPGAWGYLASALARQDKFDEAIAAYQRALSVKPDDIDLHNGLGAVLHMQGAFDDAAKHYRRTTELAPDNMVALRLLGQSLHEGGHAREAVEIYRKAVAFDPSDVVTVSNLGACLCGINEFAAAIAACEQALALKPDHAPAFTNLGIIHEKQGDADAAVAAHRRAIAADPDYAKGHANLAVALRNKGDIDGALAASYRAVALAPDNALARYNHAHYLLMCGDLVNGFQEHQWGRKCKALSEGMPSFDAPEWEGQPFAGRTLLLFADYGIGDVLQFVRYMPMVVARGGAVVLQVQPAIAALLRNLEGVTVVARGEALPPFDMQLAMMDLPRIFGTTLETIPTAIPYLHAEPAKVAKWRSTLAVSPLFKVGVVWAGNPRHKGDAQRSLPAQAVLQNLITPGVQLFSLQKETRPEDAQVLARLGNKVIDLAPVLNDFTDTAAAIATLDLVISVDTSVAHLAGGLGRPVWVLLPYALDWRWLRDREDTAWYPQMRLFRQPKPQQWDGVLTRTAAELARVAAGQRELMLPPSAR